MSAGPAPIELIETPAAAAPGGHYSQAAVAGDLVFVSGLLPVEPGAAPDATRPFEEQAECVLRSAAAILDAAGSDLAHVVKATVYIADIAQWGAFNRIFAAHFGAHRPARAVVPVPCLHHGFAVEMELVAVRRPDAA